ncbi:MAG: exodeoxyribonuclease VII small subunit [Clostridia bacterium]|nr:exodeoxyribonuclease VII small subunit [Clostridia bacterium]MBR2879027.1 exodeoxyribonuclease VII small subunit [Clostridia bacterium]MBR2973339.1 exodeoxyribonuclease VII small subunit [Clostridia bacterium]MBR3577111.1 exodeoxyribonuclease VII small subunit [Clostridia bacterium]
MAEKKTFEELIQELGDTVRKLDNGQTPLDEAMELFEKGVKLTKECNKILDTAEKKVSLLLKNSEGEITETKMEE